MFLASRKFTTILDAAQNLLMPARRQQILSKCWVPQSVIKFAITTNLYTELVSERLGLFINIKLKKKMSLYNALCFITLDVAMRKTREDLILKTKISLVAVSSIIVQRVFLGLQ